MKKHILIISTMIILSLATIIVSILTRYRNSSPSSKMSESPSKNLEEMNPSPQVLTQSSLQVLEPNSSLTTEDTKMEAVSENRDNKVIAEARSPSTQGSLSSDNTSFIDNTNFHEQKKQESQEKVTMNEDNNTSMTKAELLEILTKAKLLERMVNERSDPNTPPQRRRELSKLISELDREINEAINRHAKPSTSGIRMSGARVHQSQ